MTRIFRSFTPLTTLVRGLTALGLTVGLAASLGACNDGTTDATATAGSDSDTDTDTCTPGQFECSCKSEFRCDEGLVCASKVCTYPADFTTTDFTTTGNGDGSSTGELDPCKQEPPSEACCTETPDFEGCAEPDTDTDGTTTTDGTTGDMPDNTTTTTTGEMVDPCEEGVTLECCTEQPEFFGCDPCDIRSEDAVGPNMADCQACYACREAHDLKSQADSCDPYFQACEGNLNCTIPPANPMSDLNAQLLQCGCMNSEVPKGEGYCQVTCGTPAC